MRLFLLLVATSLLPFTTINAQTVWDGSVGESWDKGHQLTLGEVTNGEDCTISFYKNFDGQTFSERIPSGDSLDLAFGETVYVRVNLAANKLLALDDGMKATNQTTGEAIPVKVLSDSLLTFQWPEAPVSISADFIDAAYCGKEEGGRNVMWQKFMLEGNYYKLVFTGQGEIADFSDSGFGRPWGVNTSLKELVFEDGVENTGDFAFYYANALDTVSWGTLKHIGRGAFYRPYKLGVNKTIVFPSTIETIGPGAFEYGDEKGAINGIFDFSACTNLTEVGEVAFYGTSVTCILPPSVKASYKNSFKLTPYIVLPEGMTLFVNNTQMPDDGSKATINLSLSQPFTFQLKPGYYRLNLGEVNGEGCSLQFYMTKNSSNQLSNEVKVGMKALSEDEDAKLYIKANPAKDWFLHKDWIVVRKAATGEIVPITQEQPTIFSFVMPACDVTVSAAFRIGGYCGGENGGINVWYEIVDDGLLSNGNPAYKMIFSGTGATISYSSNNQAKPWNTYKNSIKSVEFRDGITNIGKCLLDNTGQLRNVQLPNTLVELGGYVFFNCNSVGLIERWDFPATLENIGDSPFRYTSQSGHQVIFDMSKCTNMKSIITSAFESTYGIKILPPSIEKIAKSAMPYSASTDNNVDNSIRLVVPEDKVVYVNGIQQIHTGDTLYFDYNKSNASIETTIEMRSGYHYAVKVGTVTGNSGSSFKFYGAYDGTSLSDEITPNTKAHDDLVGQPVYIKFNYGNYKILDEDGLRIENKSTGERVALDTVSLPDAVYSFTMPRADVEVSVDIVTGGYCGHTDVNKGYNAIWRLIENGINADGKTTYRLIISGEGPTRTFNNAATPWRSNNPYITELDVREGITAVNGYNFWGMSAIRNMECVSLPASLQVIGGEAFEGWSGFEGALVLPSGVTNIGLRAFRGSLFDLDLSQTSIKSLETALQEWGYAREGMRVTLPVSLESIQGNNIFRSASVDLSRCTKLTSITGGYWFSECKDGEIILPGSFTGLNNPVSQYGGFYNCTSKLSIAPFDDKILYINGERMEEVDGKVDISAWMGQTVEFDWRPGHSIRTDKLNGGKGSLQFYTDYNGSEPLNEIPEGYKLLDGEENKIIYVRTVSDDTHIVLQNDLGIKAIIDGAEQTVRAEQIRNDLFRFTMPTGAVRVSAFFRDGGYCGASDVNNGHNLIWTLNNGMLAFQRNTFAQGNDLTMGSSAPWKTLGRNVRKVDLSGITNIGDNAFSSCTALTGIELPASPVIRAGNNAFAKQMVLIIPAESWDSYQNAGWAAYAEQTCQDKETLTLKDGQQWRTYYSKVGRVLPEGLKAYTITGIGDAEVITSQALDYVPAGQAVLIENSRKTACTAEATTTLQPYAQLNTPVCLLTTDETNLLQWITEPTAVSAGEGYTLYKDEFVKVSTGILPTGVAFLPAQGTAASRLYIFGMENEDETAIQRIGQASDNSDWYTIDGKKLSGKPSARGIYLRNGQKVLMK